MGAGGAGGGLIRSQSWWLCSVEVPPHPQRNVAGGRLDASLPAARTFFYLHSSKLETQVADSLVHPPPLLPSSPSSEAFPNKCNLRRFCRSWGRRIGTCSDCWQHICWHPSYQHPRAQQQQQCTRFSLALLCFFCAGGSTATSFYLLGRASLVLGRGGAGPRWPGLVGRPGGDGGASGLQESNAGCMSKTTEQTTGNASLRCNIILSTKTTKRVEKIQK